MAKGYDQIFLPKLTGFLNLMASSCGRTQTQNFVSWFASFYITFCFIKHVLLFFVFVFFFSYGDVSHIGFLNNMVFIKYLTKALATK